MEQNVARGLPTRWYRFPPDAIEGRKHVCTGNFGDGHRSLLCEGAAQNLQEFSDDLGTLA